MKGLNRFLLVPTSVAACCLLAACSLFADSSDAAPVPDLFEVTIRASEDASEAVNASRTVLPDASAYVSSYSFSGEGPGNASFQLDSADPWLRTHLAPGSWNLTVRAMNESGLVLLVGSLTTLMEAGAASDLTIPLVPRIGDGALSVSFSLPAELPENTKIDVSLEALRGGASNEYSVSSPFASLILPAVASGYHLLSVRMSATAGLSEVVRVLPDTETALLVDFASIPGSAAVSALPFDGDPIALRLPAWTHRSAGLALPLEALVEPASAQVSWRLDGLAVPGDSLPAPLPLGIRRIDALASSSGGLRAGSAGLRFEVLPELSSGEFGWAGSFSPDAGFVADLPTTHGFADAAASADGRLLLALDAPAPGAVVSGLNLRSTVHLFSFSDRGVPFQTGVLPVRSDGTARSCDGIALSPDGSYVAAWKSTTSWIAFRSVDLSEPALQFHNIDAAFLGGTDSSAVKEAVFSADSRFLYALLASPFRIVCLSVGSGVPSLRWTKKLDDPAISGSTFTGLAAHPSGVLLALSSGSDIAVLLVPSSDASVPPEFAHIYKRTQGGPPWLDKPESAFPVKAGLAGTREFLLLCAESGTLGRIGLDADGSPYCEPAAESRADLVGASALESSPDGSLYAVLGPLHLLFGSQSGAFPCAAMPRAAPVPALSSVGAVAWISGRLAVAGDSVRSISLFQGGE